MTEIAQTYLGNIDRDCDLAKLIATKTCLKVLLSQGDRHKGRIHACTDHDVAVGIIKSRDRLLESGDVFQTESNRLLLVHVQQQELLVINLSALDKNIALSKLVHLGHVLGNHHHAIAIQENKIYVRVIRSKAIEKIIDDLQISGLQITYEMQSALADITFTSHNH